MLFQAAEWEDQNTIDGERDYCVIIQVNKV